MNFHYDKSNVHFKTKFMGNFMNFTVIFVAVDKWFIWLGFLVCTISLKYLQIVLMGIQIQYGGGADKNEWKFVNKEAEEEYKLISSLNWATFIL